ncbi:MAG: basic amino acid ABC transporter substrate-binding protein [Brevinema sp.]
MKFSTKAIAIVMVFTFLSCGMPKKNLLIIGTNAEFPPFEYLENNTIVGFDIDLMQAVAKELQIDIRIENLSWEGLLPALQSKKVDLIIAGMTATEDRKKIVNFSDTYYVAQEQMIILHQDNTNITTFENLIGKRVGVVLGFTGDMVVTALDDVQVERYNGAFQAIIDLQNNKINALVLDDIPAKNYVMNNNNLKVITGNNTQEEYSIAFRKEDTVLLEKVNQALSILKENGTYEMIYNKYFSVN